MNYNTTPKYSFDDVFDNSLDYFQGNSMAASSWVNKYSLFDLRSDSKNKYCELNPGDMHDRLASEIHRIELKYKNPLSYDEIRDSLDGFKKIVPQGSPMFGIGNPYSIVSLSNCTVIPSPDDSVPGIT
jgi:ribonucleoside-diphosphate reductase alpha chain